MPSIRARVALVCVWTAWLPLAAGPLVSAPPPPGRPSNVIALAVGENAIRIQFDDNATNETGFRVQMREGSGAFLNVRSLPKNTTQTVISGLDAGDYYQFRVQAVNGSSASQFSRLAGAYTDKTLPPSPCFDDGDTLCLGLTNRFRAEAVYRTTASGSFVPAFADRARTDAGFLSFFSPENLDVVVKILNACTPPQNRYWVFVGGVTNVEVKLTVTDTQTGKTKQYFNPLGQPFLPIQDTNAFATCP
jgi:hypothetical protein